MHRFLLAALCLAPATLLAQKPFWPDEGPRTWAPRPTVAAITANDLRTRLYQFSDDSMMGREAGTLGNVKGTDYVAREFKRLGLVPAGEHGSYFQTIGYGMLHFDSSQVTLAVAGAPLTAGSDWSPVPPSAGLQLSGSADLRSVATVFGGRFGDSTTTLTPEMVAGKAVVFTAPATVEREFRGRTMTVQAPGDYEAAQRAGAAAVLVIGPPQAAVFHSNRPSLMPTVDGKTVAAQITPEVAARLFGQSADQLALGATGQPVSGRWEYLLDSMPYPSRNVIGILPGSDPKLKSEYVVIGAHNDHVGMVRGTPPEHDSLRAFNTVMRPQGANDRVNNEDVTPQQWAQINALIAAARKVRPPRADSVMNGADDDGSGTAVLLEIAERMASGERPARSIVFNSHVAEEKGLLGSSWFVDHPTIPLDSVSAVLNMDMLGKGRVTDVKFGGPNSVQMLGSRRLSAEYGDLIDSLNAVRSEPMAIDYSWDRTNALNRFCRSDQVNYIRKGIPTTYFSLGYARDYHQATDEPQYIDYDHGARLGRFIHDIALTIANRPTKLAILPEDQQDKSAKCGG